MLNIESTKAMFAAKKAFDSRETLNFFSNRYDSVTHYHLQSLIEMCETLDHARNIGGIEQKLSYFHCSDSLVCVLHYYLSNLNNTCHGNVDLAMHQFMEDNNDDFGIIEFDCDQYVLSEMSGFRLITLQLALMSVNRTSLPLIGQVLASCGRTWQDLHQLFLGKTLLAVFRIDHGYEDGSYVKIWSGREDSDHLNDLISELDGSEDFCYGSVYSALSDRYLSSLISDGGSKRVH
jgi:hypothetical protein